MARIILLICIVAFACVFAGRASAESRSPRPTPQPSAPPSIQTEDQIWKSFAKCKVKLNKDFSFSITFIPSVKAMNGKVTTISGYMLPLESTEKFTHFLLSRRAFTCAFCSPGEPNEIVEVFSTKPVMWKEDLVTVTGTLVLLNAGEGIFFQMKNAVTK